ncbi:serine hydrolase [Streptomyces sp. BA2]|uniref:serine hydrolase n=1 Tax=Streptomyces sp. BA2 TaxID=436595 RepID=UPI001F382DB5|nr:serine hydrolase domain-containing protein [Streptomyces sp. BA2]
MGPGVHRSGLGPTPHDLRARTRSEPQCLARLRRPVPTARLAGWRPRRPDLHRTTRSVPHSRGAARPGRDRRSAGHAPRTPRARGVPPRVRAHVPHFNASAASAAKSYLGLVAAALAHEGQLDRGAQVSKYIPELAGTAFGDAQVDHLLHMGTQMTYAGRPYDKALEAQRYFAVLAPQLRPYGYTGPDTIREHLGTARATAEPGTAFRYENGNVEALAEVLRRVTGTTTSAL